MRQSFDRSNWARASTLLRKPVTNRSTVTQAFGYATTTNQPSADATSIDQNSKLESDSQSSRNADPSSLDLIKFLQLIKSGTPHDLSHLFMEINQILDPTLHPTASDAQRDIRVILDHGEIWSSYIQALLQIEGTKSGVTITDITKLIQQRTRQRQKILDLIPIPATQQAPSVPSASTSETALNRLLASVNLTSSSLISSIFNRIGQKATVKPSSASDLHEANQQAIAASSKSSGTSDSNASGSQDPVGTIRVVVEEFKGNMGMRALRFLGVTLVYSFIVSGFQFQMMPAMPITWLNSVNMMFGWIFSRCSLYSAW